MDYEYLSLAIGDAGAERHRRADSAERAAVTGWALGALRQVADGAGRVRAVAHPLGFTCLPMERSGRYGVCVHLWGPGSARRAPPVSAVHAHCWDLTSYALFGTLENRFMLVTGTSGTPDDDERGCHRLLEVRSEGDVDELVPTGRLVRCVPGQSQAIRAGDVYSLPAGHFHATLLPPGETAATVALGRMVPGAADFSLGPPGAAGRRTRRTRCDEEQTAATARAVLDRLLTTAASPRLRPDRLRPEQGGDR